MGAVDGRQGSTNLASCGGPRPGNCDFTVSPLTVSAGASGGTYSASVASDRRECTWSAQSNASWIRLTRPAAGVDTCGLPQASQEFTVDANTATSSRTGTIRVAGKDVQVTQAAAQPNCQYSLTSAKNVSFGSGGGTGVATFTLVSGTGCTWTATAPAAFPWITVTDQSGTGNISVRYSVSANTSTAGRDGRIEVRWPGPQAGENILITQAGR